MTEASQRAGYARFDRLIGLAVPAALGLACVLVILPFAAPLLWSAIIVTALWTPLEAATRFLGGRRGLVAVLLSVVMTALIVLPAIALTNAAVDAVPRVMTMARELGTAAATNGPVWLGNLPVVGPSLAQFISQLASDASGVIDAVGRAAPSVAGWLATQGLAVGGTILQLVLVALATGVMYAQGPAAAAMLDRLARKVGGDQGEEMLDVAARAIRGVSAGVVGTALAQAVLAAPAFYIAGAPAALLLTVAVLVLGIVQIGPLPVWLPVCLWLYSQDETVTSIVLGAWCLGVVQTVDNILRPLLISRGAKLPLLLMLVGVLGGLIAFGLIGVFLGPTLLGVGYALVRRWLEMELPSEAKPAARLEPGARPGSPPSAAS